MFEMSEKEKKKMNEDPKEVVKERKHPAGICCNFCGKSQKTVMTMIAGPGVCICNECVGLCNDIIEERRKELLKGIEVAYATMMQLIKEERLMGSFPEHTLDAKYLFSEDSPTTKACLEGMGICFKRLQPPSCR